jgi:hypothetical protein
VISLEAGLGNQAGKALNQGLCIGWPEQVALAGSHTKGQGVEQTAVFIRKELGDDCVRNLMGRHLSVLEPRDLEAAVDENVGEGVIRSERQGGQNQPRWIIPVEQGEDLAVAIRCGHVLAAWAEV